MTKKWFDNKNDNYRYRKEKKEEEEIIQTEKSEPYFLKDKYYWIGLFYTIFSGALLIAFIRIVFNFNNKYVFYIFSLLYVLITRKFFYKFAHQIILSKKKLSKINKISIDKK